MKLLYSLVAMLIIANSQSTFAASNQCYSNNELHLSSDTNGELIVGIPNFNSKRTEEVINLISSIDGVLKVDYCESLNVFLVQFNSEKIHSSEDLFTMLEKELHDFEIYHKIGKSIDEIKGSC